MNAAHALAFIIQDISDPLLRERLLAWRRDYLAVVHSQNWGELPRDPRLDDYILKSVLRGLGEEAVKVCSIVTEREGVRAVGSITTQPLSSVPVLVISASMYVLRAEPATPTYDPPRNP